MTIECEKRASQLARSGNFANWKAVQDELGRTGGGQCMKEVGFLRGEIDRLCKEARREQT
jgi:hypothetical protein